MDRNNFANAQLEGLEADVKPSHVEYHTCISILLIVYVLFHVPSDMVLKILHKPSWYLCACLAIWGVISAATGAAHNEC